MFATLVSSLIQGILQIMLNFNQVTTPQHQVFKRQFQQYINRNKLVDCESDALTFHSATISEHKNRLVKKPGYEILLDKIENVEFVCGQDLKIRFLFKEEVIEYEFKVP